MKFFMFGLLFFAYSCADPCDDRGYVNWGRHYDIGLTDYTPEGIEIDKSGEKVNVFDVDRIVLDTWDCLKREFPHRYEDPQTLDCLVVKIVSDWRISHIDGRQLLNDPTTCVDENGEPWKEEIDPTKTCYWQSKLQDGRVVVVPPKLTNMRDPVVKYITQYYYPHRDPKMAKCAWPKGFYEQ